MIQNQTENVIDISTFTKRESCNFSLEFYLVVKSQDQVERRTRLLESKKNGKFGRLSPRPTSIGLLAKCRIDETGYSVIWTKEFREPRHISPFGDQYVLTEVNKLNIINPKGEVIKFFQKPYFGFLHTVSLNKEQTKALIVSSGYDVVFELDMTTGEITWDWFAWEQGFNPDSEGVYLTNSPNKAKEFEKQGLKAEYINPEVYGEQGLITVRRSAHPNVAVYNPYTHEQSIILSMAHNGEIYEVMMKTKSKELKTRLEQMPHGIKPFDSGWIVTNTIKGEFILFDCNFKKNRTITLINLPGKVANVKGSEWLQHVTPLESQHEVFLCLDANRGLIIVNLGNKEYSVYKPNENWCLQDILVVKEGLKGL